MYRFTKIFLSLIITTTMMSCLQQEPVFDNANNEEPGLVYIKSKDSSGVSEDGSVSNYAIKLNRAPDADVDVIIVPDSDLLIDGDSRPVTLSYSPDTWSITQDIEIGAVDDNRWEEIHTGVLTISTSSDDEFFDSFYITEIPVTIADNDGFGYEFSSGDLSVTEGSSGEYTIKLLSRPDAVGEITIDIATDSDEITIDKSSVTFNSSNWARPQAITVTAVDDDDIEGDHGAVISHSITMNNKTYDIGNVNVAIVDDEINLVFSENPLVIDENTSKVYNVSLENAPSGDVAINLIKDPGITVAPSTATFTPSDYSVEITVNADDDYIVVGNRSVNIYHQHASSGIVVKTLRVDIVEDDEAGIEITTTLPFTVTESGTSATYTVSLKSRPEADVNLEIASPDGQVGILNSSHTIAPNDWATAIAITVEADDDMMPESGLSAVHNSMIRHTLTSEDKNYNLSQDLTVNIEDNEVCVSGNYPPGGDGSPENPYSTIQEARNNTAISSATLINYLVAQGNSDYISTESEPIMLDDGESLYGGYDDDSWSRSIFENPTVIIGTLQHTIYVNSSMTTNTVTIDGFTIYNDNMESGIESACIFIDSNRAIISNNQIFASKGNLSDADSHGIHTSSSEAFIFNNIIHGGANGNTTGITFSGTTGGLYHNTIDGGAATNNSIGIEFVNGSQISVINNIIFTEASTKRIGVYESDPSGNDLPLDFSANAIFDCPDIFYSVDSNDTCTNIFAVNDYFELQKGIRPDPENVDVLPAISTNMFQDFPNYNWRLNGRIVIVGSPAPDNIKFGGADLNDFTGIGDDAISKLLTDPDGKPRTPGNDPGNGGDGWSIGAYEQDD